MSSTNWYILHNLSAKMPLIWDKTEHTYILRYLIIGYEQNLIIFLSERKEHAI